MEFLGILHSDIKPRNIGYCRERGALLFDWGVACDVSDKKRRGGSSAYMPPEFLTCHGFPSEIYAAGLTVAFYCGHTKLPESYFPAWNISNAKAKKGDYEKFQKCLDMVQEIRRRLDLSIAVQKLIYDMLNPDPNCRPTASDVEERLCTIEDKIGIHGPLEVRTCDVN